MQQKDQRIRLTSEVLNGIKVIKLYAWEEHFQKDVKDIRNNEMAELRKFAYLNAGLSFSWSCAPFLVTNFWVFFKGYMCVRVCTVYTTAKYLNLMQFAALQMQLAVLLMQSL